MREAIARVWYLNPSDAEQQYKTYQGGRSLSSSFYHALEMRLTQRALFDELAAALGIQESKIGRPSVSVFRRQRVSKSRRSAIVGEREA